MQEEEGDDLRGRGDVKRGPQLEFATSEFYGDEETDYQGRSWVAPPSGKRPSDGSHACFPPKRQIHVYKGHEKGVQAIRFFPYYGHLLLSASMDTTVRIWDTAGDRGMRRVYNGKLFLFFLFLSFWSARYSSESHFERYPPGSPLLGVDKPYLSNNANINPGVDDLRCATFAQRCSRPLSVRTHTYTHTHVCGVVCA